MKQNKRNREKKLIEVTKFTLTTKTNHFKSESQGHMKNDSSKLSTYECSRLYLIFVIYLSKNEAFKWTRLVEDKTKTFLSK